MTVLAPSVLYPTPELAAFMVFDAGGGADARPITIDGNGRLIDGASTFVHRYAGATVLFLLDQASNQWRVAILPSTDQQANQAFYLRRDLLATLPAADIGPVTVLNLDFSALPNQSLAVDGAVVIDGKTWTKSNSANDFAPMAIVNGSGLVIRPTTSSPLTGPTRNLPLIRLPFSQLAMPSWLSNTSGIRIYALLASVTGLSGAGNVFSAGIDNGGTAWAAFLQANFNTAGLAQYISGAGFTCNNSSSIVTDGGGGNVANYNAATRVQILDIPRMIGDGANYWAAYLSGPYAGGWPSGSAITPIINPSLTNTGGSIGCRFFPSDIGTMGVFLGGAAPNGVNQPIYTIARLRVDVYP